MSKEVVSTLSVELEANQDRLDRDLAQAEEKTKASGEKMEKSLSVEAKATMQGMTGASGAMKDSAESLGVAQRSLDKSAKALEAVSKVAAVAVALDGGVKAIEGSISVVQGLAAAVRDDWDAAAASIESAAASFNSVPVVGQVFGIGNRIGEAIFNDQADARAIEAQVARQEAARIQETARKAGLQSRLDRIERAFPQLLERTENRLELSGTRPEERALVAQEQRQNARIADIERQRDSFLEIAESIGLTQGHINDLLPDYDRLIAKSRQLGEAQRDELLGAAEDRRLREDRALSERVRESRRERFERQQEIRDRIDLLEATSQKERELLREQARFRDEFKDADTFGERALLAQESALRQREIAIANAPSVESFTAEQFLRLGSAGPGGRQEVRDVEATGILGRVEVILEQIKNSPRSASFG